MLRRFLYTAALSTLVPAVAMAGGEYKVRGLTLPGGAVRIAEDRYRMPENWQASLKFLKGLYRPEKYPRRLVINQPGIKAIHVENPESESEWEGFNLYEYQGEVRLYVLARERK